MVLTQTIEKTENPIYSEVVPSASSSLVETELQTVNLSTMDTESTTDYLMESKDVIKCKKENDEVISLSKA